MKRLIILFLILLSIQINGQVLRTYSSYKGVVATGGGGNTPPASITTNLWARYIAGNESYFTKDGSQHITVWADSAGNHNMSNYSSTPHWSSGEVLLPTTADLMGTGATTLNQPIMIYMVFKQTTWVAQKVIFYGWGTDPTLVQGGDPEQSPNIAVFAGTTDIGGDAGPTLDSYCIIRVLFNGTSSKFIINGGTPYTGDPGTNNMGGFAIGGTYSSTSAVCGYKEIIIKTAADSSGDESDIYNYLKTKYGL